jgi:hypothetical protein
MDTPLLVNRAFEQKPRYRASLGDWIQSRGHAHRHAARRFFHELSAYRSSLLSTGSLPHTWLLPFRSDFRRLLTDENMPEIESLAHGDATLRPLYVWLLSHSGYPYRLYAIRRLGGDPSPHVRKHVAKALQRLEAWWLLDDMAAMYPEDARVRWFAQSPVTHRPFAERLKTFARNVDETYASEVLTPSRMPFWALERSWVRTPPKSREFIRRMLWRIRHWVRWGVG